MGHPRRSEGPCPGRTWNCVRCKRVKGHHWKCLCDMHVGSNYNHGSAHDWTLVRPRSASRGRHEKCKTGKGKGYDDDAQRPKSLNITISRIMSITRADLVSAGPAVHVSEELPAPADHEAVRAFKKRIYQQINAFAGVGIAAKAANGPTDQSLEEISIY
eukprot:3502743-Pyramimonas_sp.AAC.1